MNNYVLKVTSVHMKVKHSSNGMKAICNIILNGMVAINDIRVIENKAGKLFVAMPSRKMLDGSYRDFCNPINPDARTIIEGAVLEEYQRMTTLDAGILKLIDYV